MSKIKSKHGASPVSWLSLGLVLFALSGLYGCGTAGGNLRMARGDYKGAESEFRSMLAEDPGDVTVRRRLGRALYQQGRYQEASAELDRAASMATLPPEDQILRGLAAIGAGERERGFDILSGFTHWEKYRIQEQVRQEAARLQGTDAGLGLVTERLDAAWARGEELERIDRQNDSDMHSENRSLPSEGWAGRSV